jgi:hypothetical protein
MHFLTVWDTQVQDVITLTHAKLQESKLKLEN